MNAKDPVLPRVVEAAVALTAMYFPSVLPADGAGAARTTHRKDVCFVLDGHVDSWSSWDGLSPVDARRFGRLLRRRPNDLANAEVTERLLNDLLKSGALPGCRPAPDYDDSGLLVVSPGIPLAEHADACLDLLDDHLRDRDRCREHARPGPHHSTLRTGGRRVVDARYELLPHHIVAPQQLPMVVDAPPLPQLRVPLAELAEVADRLDKAHRTQHRSKSVARFRERVRDRHGQTIKELDLAAGELNQLLAYTGFGKSVVMIEVFACWAAAHDLVVSFVLPNNSDVMKAAELIERSFTELDIDVEVTPLVSPRSMLQVAETTTGVDRKWLWKKLGYGCGLAATATDEAVDSWRPGQEPCGSLKRPPRGREHRDQLVACPFRASCDRFKLVRAALTAGVIITSHGNLHLGVLQYPVDDGFGGTEHMPVEELLLRRSHVMVIDEVDTFQSGTLDQAGKGLLLDQASRTDTPLRRFDSEFGQAFGLVREEVDANVRDAHAVLRYLSEIYVSHLAYDRLGPARTSSRYNGPQRTWIVPRRWDRWLTGQLFEVAEDAAVTPAQRRSFESLYDPRIHRAKGESALFRSLRHHLSLVVNVGVGASNINRVRSRIDALLAKPRRSRDGTVRPAVVPDGLVRARVVSRMIRRALLEQIRAHLHRLMNNSAQLVDVGVESMQHIADALGTYGRWRAVPTGPLGRLVFAFTEYLDVENTSSTWLRTAAFGGDPHVYVPRLGDVTALAHAGVRRIVLGLSATTYFPRAPQHHVHVKPRWYVSDDNESEVTVEAAEVLDGDEPIRISGRSGADRAEATRVLARMLWARSLEKELLRLQEQNDDRARVLLATTSYESAVHVAEGLLSAGVAPWRICVATKPNPESAAEVDQDPPDDLWRVLPADQLDRFPRLRADVLIAPLARVQRGVNIIGTADRSALGSVWLLIRPIPLIDEPAELVAHIQSKSLRLNSEPTGSPLEVLAARRKDAGLFFDEITRSLPYFRTQPVEVRVSVAAEIINGAIQLIGRARRGGTSATLHLVDGSFLDAGPGADFATLVQLLRRAWQSDGELELMKRLYGNTLDAFFTYADEHGQLPAWEPAPTHLPENQC